MTRSESQSPRRSDESSHGDARATWTTGSCESATADDDPGRAWMLAFQSGEDEAFDRIVLGYQTQVSRFLSRYLRDAHRTEDLTQEVFVRVYTARDRYQPTASFRSWVFTIATRLAFNEIRGLRRRRRVFVEASSRDGSDISDAGHPVDRAADPGGNAPGKPVEDRELLEVLDALVVELPEKQRAVVVLSHVLDFSHKEIATALETSVVAVKSLLLRARETLRGRLDRYLAGKSLALPDGALGCLRPALGSFAESSSIALGRVEIPRDAARSSEESKGRRESP